MKREQALAAYVVQWLQAQHWEVYQEVQTSRFGRRCDIVAVQGGISWCIEAKMSLSLALLDQAIEWVPHTNFVSVAVPRTKRAKRPRCLTYLLQHFGIGQLVVDENGGITAYAPRPHRPRRDMRIVDCVCEAQKTFALAGNSNGLRWTPYMETCRVARAYITQHGPTPLRDLINGISHHYASDKTAVACLRHWLQLGKVAGLALTEGRPAKVILAE